MLKVIKKILSILNLIHNFSPSIVHYVGRLHDTNEVFDSSREDNTVFSFEVGKGKVIRAWDLAFKTMKVLSVTLLFFLSVYSVIK